MDKVTSNRFNRVALEAQDNFNELIMELQRLHEGNLDWWVSSPLSRNIFLSPLFHHYCSIILLRELADEKNKDLIILTDSTASAWLFREYFKKRNISIKVKYRLSLKGHILQILRPWHYFISVSFRGLLLFALCRISERKKKTIPSTSIVLIDTFIPSGFVNNEIYYPGLVDSLTNSEKELVFFVPTLVGIGLRDMSSILKEVRDSERKFLLREDCLKLQDYLYAGMHFFRIRRLGKKGYSFFFSGLDIFTLVREEVRSGVGFGQSFLALLNYRFTFRLKQMDVRLRLVIDWFENQAIDKGWNIGFRKFFPDVRIKGYQGSYVTNYYMCVCPTEKEMDSSVIPNEISVIGRGSIQSVLRYCPNLSVSVAPAFRFQHLWREKGKEKSSRCYIILVALPIMLNDAVIILQILLKSARFMENDMQVLIKPHPTTSLDLIKTKLNVELPVNFQFASGNLRDNLEGSDLLISAMSSACLESLAKGIPVIVIGNIKGLTHNPIPPSINSDLWKLCYEPDDLVEAIRFYRNRTIEKIEEHKKEGEKIRRDYFEPVTPDGVRRFLGLNINFDQR